mmetsp:Transcript_556/g.1779  ORF Transcript_556/g.1779 Transcript_556/m.1779 type:complete len:1051 (-) Transcript_556:130-3282(-)
MGNIFHDAQQWELALESYKTAAQRAKNLKASSLPPGTASTGVDDISVYALKPMGHSTFIAAVVHDFETEAELRRPLLKALTSMGEVGLAQLASTLGQHQALPLHPWMSLYLPMPPGLRHTISKTMSELMYEMSVNQLRTTSVNLPTRAQYKREFGPSMGPHNLVRRLRVGFASSDFLHVATLGVMAHIFEALDHSRIESYMILPSRSKDSTPYSEKVLQSADHVLDLTPLTSSIPAASHAVRKLNLDVLFDMDGYTNEGARLPWLSSVRHAPVTISWYSYPGPLGNPLMDYVLADPVVLPLASTQFHSSAPLYVPPSYFPRPHEAVLPKQSINFLEKRLKHNLPLYMPDNGIVFASFASATKIRKELFSVWCSVLAEVPYARLALIDSSPPAKTRLLSLADSYGVKNQIRFILLNGTRQENSVLLASIADVVVETTMYTDASGVMDSLWYGIPAVTCVGDCSDVMDAPEDTDGMASRLGASLISSLDLVDELIAWNLEDYRSIMLLLARDHPYLTWLKQKLKSKQSMWSVPAQGKVLSEAVVDAFVHFVKRGAPKVIYSAGASAEMELPHRFTPEVAARENPRRNASALSLEEALRHDPEKLCYLGVGRLRVLLDSQGMSTHSLPVNRNSLLGVAASILSIQDLDCDAVRSSGSAPPGAKSMSGKDASLGSPFVQVEDPKICRPPATPSQFAIDTMVPPSKVSDVVARPVIGLMITKEDDAVLAEWLEAHMPLLDGLVILDGSEGNATRRIAEDFTLRCPSRGGDLHYFHERDESLVVKNDQTLRGVVHEKIRQIFGHGRWIMLCHPDEFLYHDPRMVAGLAASMNADHVFWFALHVLPHPSEKAQFFSPSRGALIQQRFQHFHHNYQFRGHPWMEGRLFVDRPWVRFTDEHGPTLPRIGLSRPYLALGDEWLAAIQKQERHNASDLEAMLYETTVDASWIPKAPAYLHYKVVDPDPGNYVAQEYPSSLHPGETFTYWHHKHHFRGPGANPVGLANPPDEDGFFIPQFEDYATVTPFRGTLEENPWCLPREFRAEREWQLSIEVEVPAQA